MFSRASLIDFSARSKSSGVGSILFAIILFVFVKHAIELRVDLHQHTDDAIDGFAIQGCGFSLATPPHADRFIIEARRDKMSLKAWA